MADLSKMKQITETPDDPRCIAIFDAYYDGRKFTIADVAKLIDVPERIAEKIVDEMKRALVHVPECKQLIAKRGANQGGHYFVDPIDDYED